jgi:hypothetical protein
MYNRIRSTARKQTVHSPANGFPQPVKQPLQTRLQALGARFRASQGETFRTPRSITL